MKLIEINTFVPVTEAEGPGKRFAVWVQGCSIRCKGCCNTHMFEPGKGKMISPDDLMKEVLKVKSVIDGVTLIGGEPFDQAGGLLPFVKQVKVHGLTVIAFTGYTLEALQLKKENSITELLSRLDLLIDGPFIKAQESLKRRWIGSDNQRIHFLSPRWQDKFDNFAVTEAGINTAEIHFDGNTVTMNGYPVKLPDQLMKLLGLPQGGG